ncbi:hypothetical protein HJC23_013764 [Cyclotella cryptica]|uniref:HMG box domain-containing protein n=1 Tax=Cyclotella cryptica TaxID=29204 RepID=A0ABD3NU40_9STRA|eukprot:CCRYP_019726-RA/>CCRYP_019726-RA protein AED:0.21 eAED:0.21 QI:0/-1/0/1/-1/1/1/0/203
MKATKSRNDGTPKPYSAYTIYFRLERIRILHENGVTDNEIKASCDPGHFDPLEHPRPIKYRDITLPPYWYSSVHRKEVEKKRKHRKQEGRFSKTILTAMISGSWREVDPEVRQYCNKLANAEKQKYNDSQKEISACDDIKADPHSSDSITLAEVCTKRPSEAEEVPNDSSRPMESVFEKIYPELFDEGSRDDGFRFNFSQGVL